MCVCVGGGLLSCGDAVMDGDSDEDGDDGREANDLLHFFHLRVGMISSNSVVNLFLYQVFRTHTHTLPT